MYRHAAIAVALFAFTSAMACSCMDDESVVKEIENGKFLQYEGAIFYGRVVSLRSAKEAEVEPIEIFFGPTGRRTLRGRGGPGEFCGGAFAAGEKFVYFPDSKGLIGLCSKRRPTARLLAALRAASQARQR